MAALCLLAWPYFLLFPSIRAARVSKEKHRYQLNLHGTYLHSKRIYCFSEIQINWMSCIFYLATLHNIQSYFSHNEKDMLVIPQTGHALSALCCSLDLKSLFLLLYLLNCSLSFELRLKVTFPKTLSLTITGQPLKSDVAAPPVSSQDTRAHL